MTITELRTELSTVNTAISNMMKTGKKYSVVGQFAVEYPSLDELQSWRNHLRGQILAKRGKTTRRTRPDFS